MASNLTFFERNMETKKTYSWIYKLILFLSFVWISLYPVVLGLSSEGILFNLGLGGNVFDTSSSIFSDYLFLVLVEALLGWAGFEIIFWIYRWFLTMKIYSFIVPTSVLKNESRFFYAFKNLIYGVFVNLCFWFPYLFVYVEFFNLLLILGLLIIFAVRLQKKYSQPIIAHFVFKTYCYPVFVYECIILLFSILEVILWLKN